MCVVVERTLPHSLSICRLACFDLLAHFTLFLLPPPHPSDNAVQHTTKCISICVFVCNLYEPLGRRGAKCRNVGKRENGSHCKKRPTALHSLRACISRTYMSDYTGTALTYYQRQGRQRRIQAISFVHSSRHQINMCNPILLCIENSFTHFPGRLEQYLHYGKQLLQSAASAAYASCLLLFFPVFTCVLLSLLFWTEENERRFRRKHTHDLIFVHRDALSVFWVRHTTQDETCPEKYLDRCSSNEQPSKLYHTTAAVAV